MNRFGNNTVVTTGAGSGLGRGAAERIAGEGANLLLVEADVEVEAPFTNCAVITIDGGQSYRY